MPDHIPGRRGTALLALAVAIVVPTAGPDAAEARPDRFERQVIREINQARHAHGLRAVHHRGRLARAADGHSLELVRTGRFTHAALDGSTATQRLARVARGPVGEVIAWSSSRRTRASRIVAGWLNSPNHRAVLLDGRFRRVGVGARRSSRGMLVTADFARR